MTVIRALCASLLALLLLGSAMASADVAVPPLSGRVVDRTMTLSQSEQAALDATLRAFEARKGSQVAVLIVPTTAPESIEQFSIRVAEAWKIGRRKVDDGAILVIAKDDRKLRIEVGYGLEGALTDVTSKRIIDQIITPKFRTGDFAGGITAGTDAILKVIDGEPLPAPEVRQPTTNFVNQLEEFGPFLLFGVLIGGGILRTIFGRLYGSIATGGLAALVVWMLIGTALLAGVAGIIAFVFTLVADSFMGGGGGRGGGYVGGSGGSWSSGSSSSSSGGFSGGGGSFGGGGASGNW
ncbi:YgcG family protein [Tardiphaga sp. vice352]|uniref:TPM domain-containing protein n=1 Tax=unclassified Tardiphaga TaxID=2631404 RepID=UPI0011656539|nr:MULTISPECIES: TPM domain-containing protein [unclassified Tardiphaga]QDM15975.1 YgcG family protein [Tardiphaga sp. vice278]QDM21075.1 YgcG family protein [Tardiphaga sp. vice154]QDM26172.1 YgcG family protein [Tardiphaga sp. vice304]QDM31318.1 YgcG family protein [Tardiphaga sp. vice352]